MRNILLNPADIAPEQVEYLDGKKIISTENKQLYGYHNINTYVSIVCGVVRVTEPGIYMISTDTSTQEDIYYNMADKIGEECTDEFFEEFPNYRDSNAVAYGCNFEWDGVIYKYYYKRTRENSNYVRAFFISSEGRKEYPFVVEPGYEVWTATYNLENGTSVSIESICNGKMYDSNEVEHNLYVVLDYKKFTLSGHDEIYYGPCHEDDWWNYWRYVGNGLYETTQPSWHGQYKQSGTYTWVSCNIGTSYDTDYDALYGYFPSHSYNYYGEDASGLPVPVIGSGGTVIDGIVNSSSIIDVDGEMICVADVYYRYPGNSTARWIFTGTTMENLTHYRKKSYFYTNEYEIVKYPALQEKNVFNTAIPGVAYVRNEDKVYYNQSGPVIVDDFGLPVFEIKSKEMVFDAYFNKELSYYHDFQCGNIYVHPDDVEKVEVVVEGSSEEKIDITEDFKNGTFVKLDIWNTIYEDPNYQPGQSGRYIYCRSIEITFTNEFMKTGKLLGITEGCLI